MLRGRRLGHHPLQGPGHLQPGPAPPIDHRALPEHELDPEHEPVLPFLAVDTVARGRQGEELDTGMPVPHRALLVVVGLARAASPRAQEVPGPALGYLVHVLLRSDPVPGHRCVCGEGPPGLARPHWCGSLQHLLRGQFTYIPRTIYIGSY